MIEQAVKIPAQVAEIGARVAEKGAETVGRVAEKASTIVKEPAQRMLKRFRPGRHPDRLLQELATMPTKKSEASFFQRMQPPVWREDDEDRRRKRAPHSGSGGSGDTQIGLINIHA
jgi:hypothetical protein